MMRDIRQAQESLKQALEIEKDNLDRFRKFVRDLEVIELGYRQCYAVAPVATDGGQNNLSLAPMNVEIVRVVDSEGRVHFQEFLPLTADPLELGERLFNQVPILSKLCSILDPNNDWRNISYLHVRIDDQEDAETAEAIADTRRFIKTLRDLLEWAALLELAESSGAPRFLLIRDGLLRTKFIKRHAVPNLAKAFEKAFHERGAMIVGVAKRSKTLTYLSLALTLEGVFERESPCFAEVPEEVEREIHQFDRTWVMADETLTEPTQSFGRLHLVKLVKGSSALVIPVDIPPWLMDRRTEVLEYLAETAKTSYPLLGYPYPLVRAHENANLSGLEMEILGDLLARSLLDLVDGNERERVLRYVNLEKGVSKGGVYSA